METRKVVIVSSGGQRKQVVETGAETLGQLKADLDAANIDYSGMTFFEGLSKTELNHDDSLLPRDIPRNGSTTNNLVFMLTVPQKKIKSGILSRQEAYAKIKELGLKEACISNYGKNFTMCKTNELLALIEAAEQPIDTPESTENVQAEAKEISSTNVEDAIRVLVDLLYKNGYFDGEEADMVLAKLHNKNSEEEPIDSPYTNSELDDMIEEFYN